MTARPLSVTTCSQYFDLFEANCFKGSSDVSFTRSSFCYSEQYTLYVAAIDNID